MASGAHRLLALRPPLLQVFETKSGCPSTRSAISAVGVPGAALYNSELARAGVLPFMPPTMSTAPLGRSVAPALERPVFMTAVDEKLLRTGSYSSVLVRPMVGERSPPAMRTLPLGKSVAMAALRAVFIVGLPDVRKVLVAVMYRSVLVRLLSPLMTKTPAMSTSPLVRSVAVATARPLVMVAGSEARKVLLAGLYSSVLARPMTPPPSPPAMST